MFDITLLELGREDVTPAASLNIQYFGAPCRFLTRLLNSLTDTKPRQSAA